MLSARTVYSFQDQATEAKEQTLSNISGSHMVWTESDAAGYLQVFYQNIKTAEKKQITTFASQKHSPRVGETKDGKVYIIWTDDREYAATGKWILYGYELSTGHDWKLNAHSQYYTRLNMNGSEFVGADNSTYDIFHYDLITNRETLVGKGRIPAVAEGKVLFKHERDGGLSLTNVKTGETRVVLDLPYHLYVWELAFDGTTALYKHSDLDLKTKYVVLDTSNPAAVPVDLTPATKKINEYFQMYIGNGQVSWVQDVGGIPVLNGYHLALKEGFKVTEGDQALRVAGFDKEGLVMKNADGSFFRKSIIRTEVPDQISSGGIALVSDDSIKKKVNAQGDELSVKDGSVSLVIPPGALSQDTDIEIKSNKEVTDSLSITKKGSTREASKAWVVTVGSPLLQKAQLTFTYDKTKWSELQTQKMVVYRWNESAKVWVAVPTLLKNGLTGITANIEGSGTYGLFVNDVTFADGRDHWARSSMEILASRGIVDGLSENQFVPEGLLKRLMKRIAKPALSCTLAVAVVISGLPLFPGDGIPRASAATISVSADPMEFNNVYGGQSNISWSYQSKSHATTLETCTVEHMDPEPEPPIVAPGEEPIEADTPYYRNTVQNITTVPDSGSKSYTHMWNGKVNGSVPANEGNYTICAVPNGASKYFYFVENVKINNPAPPAPKYIEVPANQDLTKTKHVIRGVAERGTEVFLDIQYTIRDENDLQVPGTRITNTVPIIVPFDEIGQNDGSHLTWSKGKDFSGYFTQFPLRDDNKPEKYIREWSYELELNPYEIANISGKVERLPSNPYYNAENAQKNKSGISPIVKYLRYVAPEWNITWESLAGYYYFTQSVEEVVSGSTRIAEYNLMKPFNEHPYNQNRMIKVCNDNERCPDNIPIRWNLIIEDPTLAGMISYEEFRDYLKYEQITIIHGENSAKGDPINLATGDFSFLHTNISVPAVMPLEFGVTYHSRDTYDGAIGYGWHHTFEWRLEFRENGNLYVITPDGAALWYTPNGNGTYQTPPGGYDQLAKQPDGTYRLTTPQNWVYTFRQDGMLSRIQDANGNETTLTYARTLLRKVQTEGVSLTFDYLQGGKIASVTDHTGRRVTYEYDEINHDLLAIHLPDEAVIRYRYNKKHQLEEIDNPNHSAMLKNVYDKNGRVVWQRDFYGAEIEIQYFPEQHTTVTKDDLGRVMTFEYDERFRETVVHHPDGIVDRSEYDANDNKTFKTDKNGNKWKSIYDSNGNLLQTIDPLNNTTTFHYNQWNKPDEITDALGSKTIIGYDGKGNMDTITNALGELSRINRDGRGVPTSMVNPKGETVALSNYTTGFVEFVTDPLGYKTHLQRDSLNRVTEIVDALGQVSSMEYDSRDRVTAKIDALHNREEFQYDKDSNLKYHKDAAGAETHFTYEFNRIKSVTDALSKTTEFFYDAVGNMKRKVAPNGVETEYLYNNVNRMETMIVKDKNEQGKDITLVTEFRYDGNGNLIWTKDQKGGITEIHYDERNLPDQVKDASGAKTTYAYDPMGRLIKETNALGHGMAYGYDAVGRLIKVTDALNFATSFEYDKAGRLTKTIKPGGAVWEMFYDARGLLTSTKDPLGNTTSLERDELGRVRTSSDESGATTQYGYNALGFVTSIVDAMNQATSMNYDPLGRLKSITDAKQQTTSYAYDPLGRLTSVTNALQATTSYTYDAVGNITSKTDALMRVTGYEYNNRNQLVKQINPLNQLTQLSYDSNGNVDHIKYPDNKLTAYQYDPMNRLKEIGYSDGKKVNYAYDTIGRRTSMNDSTGTTSYAYDALNRLTKVTNGANQIIGYEWTPTGQRSKVVYPDQTTVTYQYDLMDRMTGVTDASGLTTSYTYDKRGLLTQKKLPTEGISTYSYDVLGQVRELRHANQFGKVVEHLRYEYDPVGNRSRLERVEDGNDEDDTDSGEHSESMITEYAYDALNQLRQVKQYNSQTAATPTLTNYGYDAVGNRLTKQSVWDSLSNTEAYTYDSADKLLHWQSGSNYKDFTYDPRGNLLRVMGLENDDDESITNLISPTVLSQVYRSGSVTNGVYGSNPSLRSASSNSSPELMEEYIWDSANRLKQHRSAKKDISQFFYDGDGNRTKMIVDVDHGPTDHSVGGNGQGNSNGNNGNGNNGNGNGNNGNGNGNGNGKNKCHEVPPGFIPPGLAKKCGQVEEPYPDMHPGGPREGWEKQFKKKHWEFNYTNDVSLANPEPLQVTDKDQLSGSNDFYRWKESYTYGAGGERFSMTYLPAYDANNGWDPHDGTAGAEKGIAPRTLWYLNDALGSAVGLIEKDGRVSSRYHYDEFGIPTDAKKFDVNWPGPDNLFGYTGLGYDYNSGLSYASARYYKPELGRFVSEDTYKGDMWNPQTLNLYTYVANNPLRYIDPSGHDFSLRELESDAVQIGRLGYNSDRAQTVALYGLYAGVNMRSKASAYAKAHDPQYYKGTLITWDNEADAYRHFGWNFKISNTYGVKEAEAITANHEFLATENYKILSSSDGKATLSVQIATLMDFYNNNEGRYLGQHYDDINEAFKFALDNNAVITSLYQVTDRFGFDKSLIYKGSDGKLYVNAVIKLENPEYGVTIDDFKKYSYWTYVSQ
ncbi:DUF6531 domain-containing protein [Paenibacillus alginolyticus]|nr:DUF6531 domain-containing protein [Paenibacillus alginolyticus]MEC0147840.1 DUF6531 domain-containing protein [Paenibacillus alginolyticus]